MPSDEVQPIIIKRIKRRHGGHHGGAWKVAFADFMTAMMAFFLVMWLVGQKPEVREAVAGFFRDPGKFKSQGQSGLLKGSQSILPKANPDIGLNPTDKKKSTSQEEKQELTLTAKRIFEELKKQKEFEKLRKNIKLQMTSEGLRITLNESEKSAAFFEPGSAKLLQKSAIILMTIAKELGKLDNRIVIEGHTDVSFGGGRGYSNWELSADRANAARRLLEVSGLYEGQTAAVRGFADKLLMFPDNPADERNRRVTLLVLYKSREGQYDHLEMGADLMAAADE